MDWFYDFASPLLDAIGWLLAAFYSVIPNLGVAIILLTFTIMLLLYPLTAKQAKSMMAMQRVQPEVKKLQAKYKGDRQKLNEEMMKFYQENKINPLAGCLPLVAQLPIFISLFGVLNDSQKYIPTDSSLYHALCDAPAKCLKGTVNAQYFLGMNLELSATDTHDGILDAAPYFILVGLVMLTGFMQTRQAQKRTPAANKQMGMVMKVLPVFFGLISLSFPSGLVLYFFVSNLWRLGQQEVIFRRHGMGSPAANGGAKPKAAKGGTKAAVIEADSRVLDDEDLDDTEDEAPRPIMPAKPKPAAKAEPTAPASEAPKKSGGLRSLFQMPPPPEPNGGGAAPARALPSSGSGGGSTGGGSGGGQPRPPQQRRRSKKKKRKR